MDSIDTTRIESLLTSKPYKRYIKATLGRVVVKILDPISLKETEIVLSGNPAQKPKSCILDIWTPAEDIYMRRNNSIILNDGLIIEYAEDIDQAPSVNAVSDDEIRAALAGKYFNMRAMLDKFTSPIPVERMLALATEMDRPVKTIAAITEKLAELQAKEYENTGLLTQPDTSEE